MSPCCLLPIAGGCCWRSTSGGDKVTIASNTSSILHAGGADGRAITTCNRLEIVFTLQIKLLFAKPALKSDSRGFSKETADVPFFTHQGGGRNSCKKNVYYVLPSNKVRFFAGQGGFQRDQQCMNRRDETDSWKHLVCLCWGKEVLMVDGGEGGQTAFQRRPGVSTSTRSLSHLKNSIPSSGTCRAV